MSKGKQTNIPPERPTAKRVTTFSQSVIEELAYPIVHYPGFYAAFFAFQRNELSKITFCSCAYETIKNFIGFKEADKSVNVDPTRNYMLDLMYFQKIVSEHLDHYMSLVPVYASRPYNHRTSQIHYTSPLTAKSTYR